MSTQASHAIRQHPQFAILVKKRTSLGTVQNFV